MAEVQEEQLKTDNSRASCLGGDGCLLGCFLVPGLCSDWISAQCVPVSLNLHMRRHIPCLECLVLMAGARLLSTSLLVLGMLLVVRGPRRPDLAPALLGVSVDIGAGIGPRDPRDVALLSGGVDIRAPALLGRPVAKVRPVAAHELLGKVARLAAGRPGVAFLSSRVWLVVACDYAWLC